MRGVAHSNTPDLGKSQMIATIADTVPGDTRGRIKAREDMGHRRGGNVRNRRMSGDILAGRWLGEHQPRVVP